jgi:type IV pilus assembly protein PilC
MPIYTWKGINSYGEKRKGETEAPDQVAALAHTKRLRIKDAIIKEKPKDILADIAIFQPRVTGKDIVVFTRQLSTMIDAGLPLVQSIDILSKQQENTTFKKVLLTIKSDRNRYNFC